MHTSIGVLGGVTVATATAIDGTIAAALAGPRRADGAIRIEHPASYIDTLVAVELTDDGWHARQSSVVRSARKLFDGVIWPWEAGGT